ncbi:MAG: alpha/beta fold hydrolase [Bacteroidales bacterium]|nr:alpha/beta fold hydrolase [Bacteroidales bacterium]
MKNYTLSFPGIFKKYLYLKRILTIVTIVLFLSVSCTKEDNVEPELAENNWSYLQDTISLGNVPVSLIKLTTKLAGYPQFNEYIKYSIRLYKIVYTTTYKGETVLASGVISYPTGKTDSVPKMMVGNGLIFADVDAPSNFNLPFNYTGFEFIASLGYITLIPDMIGFGESKDLLFPIHHYEHSANTMIDFVLACNEFIKDKNLLVKEKTYLTGYSQGGYIAMATLKKIEESPVPGIHIDAAAVGAGGFNLTYLLNNALAENTYSAPSHLALLFSSYNILYDWNRPLSDFFQEPFASQIPDLISGNYDREYIDEQLSTNFDSLLNPDFIINLKNENEPGLIAALEENSVYNWAPKTTLRIIHSVNDDRIPITDSEETYNTMVANGSVSVSFTPIETEGHINSGIEFVELVFNWFESLNNN